MSFGFITTSIEESRSSPSIRIFALTPDEAADLGEIFGVERERVHVVPGGVDLDLFAPRERAEARLAATL